MNSNGLTHDTPALTLKKALELNRLDDFIAQEDARIYSAQVSSGAAGRPNASLRPSWPHIVEVGPCCPRQAIF